jgi:hypothetical protein
MAHSLNSRAINVRKIYKNGRGSILSASTKVGWFDHEFESRLSETESSYRWIPADVPDSRNQGVKNSPTVPLFVTRWCVAANTHSSS